MDIFQTDQAGEQTSSMPLAEPKKRSSSVVQSLASPIAPLLTALGIMWLVYLVDLVWRGGSFTAWGIHPRTVEGLWQIALAPFIHADIHHLIANTIPLLILGYLVIIRDKQHFILVFIIAALVSGLGIWTFGGANTVHMGASGVVFGFMGYLLARSYFERGFISILFALVALVLYGGILMGVVPGQPGVSWLGHLFGLAGGILAAYAAHRPKAKSGGSTNSKKKSKKAAYSALGDPASEDLGDQDVG